MLDYTEDDDATRLKDDREDRAAVPDKQRLLEQLLVDCEPAVRPVYNSSHPVLVHFRLAIYQIVGLVWLTSSILLASAGTVA